MNLQYYSYEEDQVYEYDSEIISKITEKKNSFDLTSKFELSISKKTTTLHIYKIENNYHLNFIRFDEKSQERIGISIDKLEVVNKFIDNYINELDFQVTKKSSPGSSS